MGPAAAGGLDCGLASSLPSTTYPTEFVAPVRTAFNVKGVLPQTERVVELTILAENAQDAKAQAEAAGLKWVVAVPAPPEAIEVEPPRT
jgi:hypothetical protein